MLLVGVAGLFGALLSGEELPVRAVSPILSLGTTIKLPARERFLYPS